MKKLLLLFIPVLAFAQTPYVTETVTITKDTNGIPIAAVINAYYGVPTGNVQSTSYDLIANPTSSVTVDGITVNYSQLAKLITAVASQQLILVTPVVVQPTSAVINNNVGLPVITTNNISITTNNTTP